MSWYSKDSIESELREALISHENTKEKLRKSLAKIEVLKEELKNKNKEIEKLINSMPNNGVADNKKVKNERSKNSMRVLMIEPGKEPYVSEACNDLESLQKAVDGLIEVVYLEENVLLVCNEEGKCLGLEGNRRVDNGDIIAGTFLICGGNEEGEMISLTNEQIVKYSERFKEPELFSAEEVENVIFIEVYCQDSEEEMEV